MGNSFLILLALATLAVFSSAQEFASAKQAIENLEAIKREVTPLQIRNATEILKHADERNTNYFIALQLLASARMDDRIELGWWQLRDSLPRIVALIAAIPQDGLLDVKLLEYRSQCSHFTAEEARKRREELDFVEKHWKELRALWVEKISAQ